MHELVNSIIFRVMFADELAHVVIHRMIDIGTSTAVPVCSSARVEQCHKHCFGFAFGVVDMHGDNLR